MLRVLGIPVDDVLLAKWKSWLAPDVQPFFVESARDWPSVDDGVITPELRDTYKLWRVDRSLDTIWLDEPTFNALPREDRARLVREQVNNRRGVVPTAKAWPDRPVRQQADGHRFVWWPSLVDDEVLARVLTADLPLSRHADVNWNRSERVLPGARQLAGTFANGSGAHCFSTALAAAGQIHLAEEWPLRDEFQEWLDAACRRGGDDQEPGTVLVWRDNTNQLPLHAAVTLGDGWVLEKPSQEWSTPRCVITIGDALRVNRARGQHLERHRIVTAV